MTSVVAVLTYPAWLLWVQLVVSLATVTCAIFLSHDVIIRRREGAERRKRKMEKESEDALTRAICKVREKVEELFGMNYKFLYHGTAEKAGPWCINVPQVAEIDLQKREGGVHIRFTYSAGQWFDCYDADGVEQARKQLDYIAETQKRQAAQSKVL